MIKIIEFRGIRNSSNFHTSTYWAVIGYKLKISHQITRVDEKVLRESG